MKEFYSQKVLEYKTTYLNDKINNYLNSKINFIYEIKQLNDEISIKINHDFEDYIGIIEEKFTIKQFSTNEIKSKINYCKINLRKNLELKLSSFISETKKYAKIENLLNEIESTTLNTKFI